MNFFFFLGTFIAIGFIILFLGVIEFSKDSNSLVERLKIPEESSILPMAQYYSFYIYEP